MNVESILKGKGIKVVTIEPEATIGDAAKILKRERIGALIVSDDGSNVRGIVSERDIVSGLGDMTKRARLLESPVSGSMTREVVTVSPEESVQDCMVKMTEQRFRHLPVVSDGKLVGVVSIGDIVKSRLEELENEAGFLREMISG